MLIPIPQKNILQLIAASVMQTFVPYTHIENYVYKITMQLITNSPVTKKFTRYDHAHVALSIKISKWWIM